MEDGRTARFLFLPEGEDPDSQVRRIGKSEFVRNLSEATQLAEFFFESLGKKGGYEFTWKAEPVSAKWLCPV